MPCINNLQGPYLGMGIKLDTPVLKRFGAALQSDIKDCEWPGCEFDGPHRAPRSRDEPNNFRWFCKVHAAHYNKAWNFFADMSDAEVEMIVRHDTVWNRPSWPIGTGPIVHAFMRGHFKDPLGSLDDEHAAHASNTNPRHGELERHVRQALTVLDLSIPINASEVKNRYKALVKRYHPDVHGVSAESEDQIKEINHAYTVIMEFLSR